MKSNIIFLVILLFSFKGNWALLSCNESFTKLSLCTLDPYYDKGDASTEPFVISVSSVTVNAVTEFDDVHHTISLDLILSVVWEDTRLTIKSDGPHGYDFITKCNPLLSTFPNKRSHEWYKLDLLDAQDIFFPTMKMKKAKKVDTEIKFGPVNEDFFWYNSLKKFFEFQQALKVTVHCPMDFSMFPFESHECIFDFGDSHQSSDTMTVMPPMIRVDGEKHCFGEEPIKLKPASLPFDIALYSRANYIHFEAGINYSYTGMGINLKRNSAETLRYTFFMPTLIFTILSLISFAIEPDMVMCDLFRFWYICNQ